jgi:uncharacterized protein
VNTLDLLRLNLLSPMVLAFVLGGVAALIRSDLKLPDALTSSISIYLLLAIGLKGGAELAETSLAQLWAPVLATLFLGLAVPIWCYGLLRGLANFSVADAAAIAAHYGSVSAVTFAATQTFLEVQQIPVEGFMPALVAILEVPAIVVALLIARTSMHSGSWHTALHELLTSKSVVLLLGGLLIGYLAGKPGLEQVAPVFVAPFKGVLTLFLLELGMVAAQRLRALREGGLFLVAFGVIMPILHGALGIWLGWLSGLSLGGALTLGVLAASASYIAAPAAVRVALPQANPGYYLTAALGVTFPFNLAIGIPLYYALATLLYR